jgi:hypothetical protein
MLTQSSLYLLKATQSFRTDEESEKLYQSLNITQEAVDDYGIVHDDRPLRALYLKQKLGVAQGGNI